MGQQYGGTYTYAQIALTQYSGTNSTGQILGKTQLLMPNVTSVQYTQATITVPPTSVNVFTTFYAKCFISSGSSFSITCMGTLIAVRLP
jgi:hypothetical protein